MVGCVGRAATLDGARPRECAVLRVRSFGIGRSAVNCVRTLSLTRVSTSRRVACELSVDCGSDGKFHPETETRERL